MSDDTDNNEPSLDRRSFFRLGARKAAKTAVDMADKRVEERTKLFVRPPFAIKELDFLLRCTRCTDCITACPHQTIFPLSARLGVEVVSTPALDLTNKACHLCEGWPCVSACKTEALVLPIAEIGEDEQPLPIAAPKLALAIIDTSTCLPFMGPECGACGSVCPIPDAIEWDMTRPQINPALCVGCGLCRESCVTDPKSIKFTTINRAA